jgi:hypothetical protein
MQINQLSIIPEGPGGKSEGAEGAEDAGPARHSRQGDRGEAGQRTPPGVGIRNIEIQKGERSGRPRIGANMP